MDKYPLDTNNDGLAHAWAGVSLLKNPSQPEGMSLFVANNPNLFWFSHVNYFDTVRRYDFRLENPYLDQPPFALPIFGVLPTLFGYTDFEPVPEVLIRIPAILASCLTLFLTYFLAEKMFGRKVALLSLLVLGFTPFYVFAHREAFLENILTPLYVGTFLALLHYLENKKKSLLVLIIVLATLAPLIKVVGIVLPVICAFWLWKQKEYKAAGVVLGSGILSLAAYVGYGFFVNGDHLKWILTAQSSRGVYGASFIDFLLKLEFYNPFRDGWYLLNFFTFFWMLFSGRKEKNYHFLSINTILIIFSIVGTAGMNNNFPWYRYPLFPFLSMSTGLFLVEIFERKKNALLFTIFTLFAVANLFLISPKFPIFASSVFLRCGVVLLGVFIFIQEFFEQDIVAKISRYIVVTTFIFFLGINMLTVLFYPKISCEVKECRLPPKIVVPMNRLE